MCKRGVGRGMCNKGSGEGVCVIRGVGRGMCNKGSGEGVCVINSLKECEPSTNVTHFEHFSLCTLRLWAVL